MTALNDPQMRQSNEMFLPARNDEDGFALLAVLGFMLLLAMILMPFAASSRIQALTSAYEYHRTRMNYAAEALNGYLSYRLASDDRWRSLADRNELSSAVCKTGRLILGVSVIPGAELVDLNTAEAELLVEGFRQVGLNADQSQRMAEAVAAFRSPAQPAVLPDENVANGFKHGPFEDIAEMHDIVFLRSVSLNALSRVFTTDGGWSVSSKGVEASRTSERYRIETAVFDGARRGGDAAIFAVGLAENTKRLGGMPPPEIAITPEPNLGCEVLLGASVSGLLLEVLQ